MYYGQGLDAVARSLSEIARAMVTAAKESKAPVTYNIIVTGDATPEAVEQAVNKVVNGD